MELQEIFDTVSTHLLTQNRKSITEINGKPEVCAYRGNNGASCAIGCLIPDAAYHPDLEGQSISDADVWVAAHPVIGSSFLGSRHAGNAKFKLLRELQMMHDGNHVEEWPVILQELANDHGLTFTPPTKGSDHGPD